MEQLKQIAALFGFNATEGFDFEKFKEHMQAKYISRDSVLNEVALQTNNEKFIEATTILKDVVEAFEHSGHPIIAFFKGMIQGKKMAHSMND